MIFCLMINLVTSIDFFIFLLIIKVKNIRLGTMLKMFIF